MATDGALFSPSSVSTISSSPRGVSALYSKLHSTVKLTIMLTVDSDQDLYILVCTNLDQSPQFSFHQISGAELVCDKE